MSDADTRGERRTISTRRLWDLGAVAGFVAAALYLTHRLWGNAHSTNWPDQALFEWMLAHGVRVVTQLEYPFGSTRMNVPDGVNILANPSMLGLTIPFSPVTMLVGPQKTFALVMLFGYAATGVAWYYVLSRHVVTSRVAALIGAAFCAFSPGMLSHGNAHPNIISQFLVPFIAWRTLRLRESGRVVRNGVVLGLLITWQLFINEEVLLLTAFGVGIFTVVVGLSRREYRRQVVPFLSGLGVAVGVAGVLLAYPLWVQFTGPGSYHGLNESIQGYGSNLAAYKAFSRLSLAGGVDTVRGLTQNPTEENSFFGWPLLILVAILVVFLYRNLVALALSTVGILFAIASLGPEIRWHARTVGTGPWSWVQPLPLFDSVVPTRFALATAPLVGVLLALAWDRWHQRVGPVPRYAIGPAVLAAALLPLVPRALPTQPRPPTPDLLVNGRLDQYVTGERSVVFVPLARNVYPDPLAWAAESTLSFRMAQGLFLGPASDSKEPGAPRYAVFTPNARPTAKTLDAVYAGGPVPEITPGMREAARADLSYWRAAAVVLVPGRHPDELRRVTTDLIGVPPRWMDGAWVWDVRSLPTPGSPVVR